MKFMGYRRAEGTVGTHNYVGILSAVVCVNEVVEAIARQVQGAVRFTHHQGCCQTPLDIGGSTGRWSGWAAIPICIR